MRKQFLGKGSHIGECLLCLPGSDVKLLLYLLGMFVCKYWRTVIVNPLQISKAWWKGKRL